MRNVNDIVAKGRRDYILAEFRCAIVQAKLAQLDIEAIAVALQHGIVTPEQAVAMFCDSDAVGFVGIELGGRR